MTDPNYTHITMLVDRSGSMRSIMSDTEGGVNTLLDDQTKEPGRATLTLVQFDDAYEVVYGPGDLAEASEFKLAPRGNTALLDAMGKSITTTGEYLKGLAEDQRPGQVIFVVATDGYENASRDWNRSQVFDLVTQQREQYGWTFIYLGANQDAIAVGASMGMLANSSITYDANNVGTQSVYASTSSVLRGARKGAAAAFTDADRKAAQR